MPINRHPLSQTGQRHVKPQSRVFEMPEYNDFEELEVIVRWERWKRNSVQGLSVV